MLIFGGKWTVTKQTVNECRINSLFHPDFSLLPTHSWICFWGTSHSARNKVLCVCVHVCISPLCVYSQPFVLVLCAVQEGLDSWHLPNPQGCLRPSPVSWPLSPTKDKGAADLVIKKENIDKKEELVQLKQFCWCIFLLTWWEMDVQKKEEKKSLSNKVIIYYEWIYIIYWSHCQIH